MKSTHSSILIFGICLSAMWLACGGPHRQGEASYQRHCAPCHMEDGSGLAALIPPLAGADFLSLHPQVLPCVIRYGLSGPIQVNGREYDQVMEAMPAIEIVEMANILNYIQHRWGDPAQFYSPDRIKALLEECGPPAKLE